MTDDEIKALQTEHAKYKSEAETHAKTANEWKTKAETLASQIAAGDPEGVQKRISTLTARAKEAEAQVLTLNERLAGLDATHQENIALVRAGIDDDDALQIVHRHHASLPEADRPSKADLVKGWREKPDTAPRILRPLFERGSGGDAGAGAGAASGAPKKPDPNAGTGRGGHGGDPTPTKGGYTADQLKTMSPAEYAAAKKAAIAAGKPASAWWL